VRSALLPLIPHSIARYQFDANKCLSCHARAGELQAPMVSIIVDLAPNGIGLWRATQSKKLVAGFLDRF
jgi:hypothetical protein